MLEHSPNQLEALGWPRQTVLVSTRQLPWHIESRIPQGLLAMGCKIVRALEVRVTWWRGDDKVENTVVLAILGLVVLGCAEA